MGILLLPLRLNSPVEQIPSIVGSRSRRAGSPAEARNDCALMGCLSSGRPMVLQLEFLCSYEDILRYLVKSID